MALHTHTYNPPTSPLAVTTQCLYWATSPSGCSCRACACSFYSPSFSPTHIQSPHLSACSNHTVSVLGDLTKWVPMSGVRVYQLDVADDSVLVEMTGAAYEKVPLWYIVDGTLGMTVCETERFQRVTLSVLDGVCGRG